MLHLCVYQPEQAMSCISEPVTQVDDVPHNRRRLQGLALRSSEGFDWLRHVPHNDLCTARYGVRIYAQLSDKEYQ